MPKMKALRHGKVAFLRYLILSVTASAQALLCVIHEPVAHMHQDTFAQIEITANDPRYSRLCNATVVLVCAHGKHFVCGVLLPSRRVGRVAVEDTHCEASLFMH